MSTSTSAPERCRSCGKPVMWAKTEKGKAMPLDTSVSRAGGNILLRDGVAIYVTTGKGDRVSHFATCPQGKSWRRPR